MEHNSGIHQNKLPDFQITYKIYLMMIKKKLKTNMTKMKIEYISISYYNETS